MFGQAKPVFAAPATTGFGFGATQFGTSASTNQPSTSIFGQPSTSTQQTSMFGSSVFGSATAPIQGTPVKFNAPLVNDIIQKNNQKVQVTAKHMCISAMKEYSDKSIEELRVDDYLQNRKSGSAVGAKGIFGPTATTPFSFGAPQTTTSSLFGSASTSQPTQSSIFGATSNAGSSIFGSTQPMTSFGQATQSSIFGSSIFGTHQTFGTPTTTTASFSLFGSQPASTQPGGFTFGKPAGGGIFGATTTTTSSLFGSPAPFGTAVASQAGNIFGGIKPTGTSIFGSTATTTTASAFGSGFSSGFGAKTTSTGLFGAAPAVSNTSFGLGTTTSSTMQAGLGTGLFGAKKPSPFGAPTNTATPAFGFGASGSATAQGTSLFGNTAGFGLGATSQSAQPTGGIFGATNTAPTGSLFNKPAVNSFGLGQTNTSTPSLFGTVPNVSTGTVVGNLFGGGLGITPSFGFGGTTGSTTQSFGTAAVTNQTVLAPLVEQLTQNARAQQHVLDMVRSMPYGQSALFRHLTAEPVSTTTLTSTSVPTHPTSSTAKASGVSVLSASAAANTLVELHRANSLSVGRSPGRVGNGLVARRPMQPMPINRRQLFSGFREDDALVSAQSPTPGDRKNSSTDGPQNQSSSAPDSHFFIRREAWKRLNIPRCVRTSIIERSSLAVSDFEQQIGETDDAEPRDSCLQRTPQLSKGSGDTNASSTSTSKVQSLDSSTSTPLSSWNTTINGVKEGEKKQLPFTASSSPQVSDGASRGCEQLDTGNWTLPPDVTLNQTTLIAPSEEVCAEESDSHTTSTANKAGIRLSKPGYYMFPTFEELDALIDENGRCVVQDFVIGRQSYGHILFPGLTDITGIDFNEVVHIRRREVVVYPDDTTKPPQGYGLNRKAEITLDGVWPTDKSTREFIKSPERLAAIRFDERLEKATHKMDASFIEYRPDTGSWVFEVKHFSKYRLEDSDDEGEQNIQHPSDATNKRHATVEVDDTRLVGPADDLIGSPDPFVSTKDHENKRLSPDETSVLEMQISSSQAPQAFRGARDSLFVTASGFDGDEFDIQMGDEDSDFLMRPRIDRPNNTLPSGHIEPPAFPEASDDVVSRRTVLHSSFTEETNGESQFLPKLETLHSILTPIPDLLPSFKIERSSYSIPYERIAKLVDGALPSPTCLQGCYLDAGLSRGDTARLSWSLLRRKGKPPELVFLTADPSTDPAASVVASSVFSTIDPHEEVLLNSALLTSVQTSFETGSTSCPLFYPEAGPRVLDAYLACMDRAAADNGLSVRMRALRRPLLLCQSLWARHDTSVHTGCSGDVTDALGLHDHFVTRNRNSKLAEEESYLFPASSPTAAAMNDLARRQAVSEWIRFELRPWLDSRLNELGLANLLKVEGSSQDPWNLDENVSKSSIFAGIFACLCCGEPAVACRLALTCRMSHLASCLSMAPISDPLCKQALKKQLRVWDELKVLSFMPQQILRAYALLAGEIKISISSPKGKAVLNVLAGVPYMQVLGVHLWYLADHSTDLLTVLKLFSHNWHAYDSFEVAPPRPPEDKDLMTGCMGHDDTEYAPTPVKLSRSSSRDVCYHLLRLASRPWHSLERTLDPQSMQCDRWRRGSGEATTSSSNWPSSWHLWRVLFSIGLSSLNPIATSRLHVEMASHLETGGLWEWAVFALMHEVEPRVRAASVKQLLARHVTLKYPLQTANYQWRLDEESVNRFNQAEAFIVDRLGVPVKWLHEAKASLARSLLVTQSASSNAETHRLLASLEAAHWLAAGHLEAAHDVYVKYLLPDIVLHSDALSVSSTSAVKIASRSSALLAFKLLTALQPFIAIPQESLPTAFETGAGVYLAYARILHLVGQLAPSNRVEGEEIERDVNVEASPIGPTSTTSETLLDLQANMHRLVGLLQSMPTPSVRDRVVKSEMAVTIVRLISVFLHDRPSPQPFDLSPSQAEPTMCTTISTAFPVDEESFLLCQRLNLLANVESPSETRLNELQTLTASGIAKCIL
ncbi:Nuclear pore complex protein Nup98-Nup96 [Taenia solium]|eukprot:TsM_000873600 transcript=TsM_000873600 gene=TsM_000873600